MGNLNQQKQKHPSIMKSTTATTLISLSILLALLSAPVTSTEEYKPYFTEEEFYREFNNPDSKHEEILTARRYFKTDKDVIDKERYKALLKLYMDGTVHDMPIDEEIREEAHLQIEERIDEYFEKKMADRDEFTIHDLFLDGVSDRYHNWLDQRYPEHHHILETGEDL